MKTVSQETPSGEAPPTQELHLRVSFRPGLYEPMEFSVWRMTLDINPETGQHHLVLYDKKGEVFSHDGCTPGIKDIEFLDSRYRDESGNVLDE